MYYAIFNTMIEAVVIKTDPFYEVHIIKDNRRKRCFLSTHGNEEWKPHKNQGVLISEIGAHTYIICGISSTPPDVAWRVGKGKDGIAVATDGTTIISKANTQVSFLENEFKIRSDSVKIYGDGVSITTKDVKDDLSPEFKLEVTNSVKQPYSLIIGGLQTSLEETLNAYKRTIGFSGSQTIGDTTYEHNSTTSAKHTTPVYEVNASVSAKINSKDIIAGPAGSTFAVRYTELTSILTTLLTLLSTLTTPGDVIFPATGTAISNLIDKLSTIKSQNLKID